MEDCFVNIQNVCASYGITPTKEQQQYLLNIEKLVHNNIRDDFALLCNLYKFHDSLKGSRVVKCTKTKNEINFILLLGYQFGFAEKTIYNYLQIASKFIDFLAGEKYKIPELRDFTISKLQELMPLSIDSIQQAISTNKISCKSTKQQLRDYVKHVNEQKNKVVEKTSTENIELSKLNVSSVENYNPDEHSKISIDLSEDVRKFCLTKIGERKKYKTLDEYIEYLIRKEMK